MSTTLDNGIDFEDWYTEWLPKATSMAKRLRIEDADGAAAEVMLTIWRKGYLGTWDPQGGSALSTYTYTIIHRRLLDALTSQKRRRRCETPSSFETTFTEAHDEALELDAGELDESLDRIESLSVLTDLAHRVAQTDCSSSRVGPKVVFAALAKAAAAGDSPSDPEAARALGVPTTTYRPQRHQLAGLLDQLGGREALA